MTSGDDTLWPVAMRHMQAATTLRAVVRGENRPNYELHGPCPRCGGADRFIVQPNRGRWMCRNCSRTEQGGYRWGDGLGYLALELGIDRGEAWRRYASDDTPIPPVKRRPEARPAAQDAPGRAFAPVPIEEFNRGINPCREGILAAWAGYKPVSAEMVDDYSLGVGPVPRNRCRCDRLLIPVTDGHLVHCIRGRLPAGATCPHDSKNWIANAGFSLRSLPLFNAHRIADGAVAVIVENPVDAMLLSELPDVAYQWLRQGVDMGILAPHLARAMALAKRGIRPIVGVATLSAGYWQSGWEAALAGASLVIVALDNDLVGNGGGAGRKELLEAWDRDHVDRPIRAPAPFGLARQARLRQRGIRAVMYQWPESPPVKDFGEWLREQQLRIPAQQV